MVPSLIIEVLNDLVVPSLIIDKSTGMTWWFQVSLYIEVLNDLVVPSLIIDKSTGMTWWFQVSLLKFLMTWWFQVSLLISPQA